MPAGIKEKLSLMQRFLIRKISEYEEMRSEIESFLPEAFLRNNKALTSI
jgi:hypothetical protein